MSENNRTEKTDYCASVKTGLRRLESEKLQFLGQGNVISKFDAESLEAYNIPPDAQDDEDTLSFSTEEMSQITLEDVQNISSQEIESVESHQSLHLSGDNELSPIAEIVANEVASLAVENASLAMKPNIAFDLNAIKSQRSKTAQFRTEELVSEDDRSLAHDLTASAQIVREQYAEQNAFEKQAEEVKKNLSIVGGSQILKPGVVSSKRRDESGMSAMEKLKNQGLFDKLQVHSEVIKNIQEISQLNEILPPSQVETYSEAEELVGENESGHELSTVVSDSDVQDVYDPETYDLENRETIPVSMNAIPADYFKKNPANNRNSQVQARLLIAIILSIVVLISLVVFLLVSGKLKKQSEHSQITSVVETAPKASNKEAVGKAVDEVSSLVSNVFGADAWVKAWVDKSIEESITLDDQIAVYERASYLSEDNRSYIELFTETCIKSGNFAYARTRLKEMPDYSEGGTLHLEMRDKTFMSDPSFNSPVTDLTSEMCERLEPLGGGSTITLKCKQGEESVGAIKPEQTRRQSNYRSEIAAWRLCQLLECKFEIPWNRPIRIEHAVFESLYGKAKAKNRASYRSGFKDLVWVKEDGKTWVYATLKDWVPNFTLFPIEMTQIWKNWFNPKAPVEVYPELSKALSPIGKNKNISKYLPRLLEQSPTMTTEMLAAQISDIVVFDFLTENWDRFSTSAAYWGVNCQFKDDHIVSIDNGASFPNYTNEAVKKRFNMVQRYSRDLIENLRNLDKERTLSMLFPNFSDNERKGFEIFWKHRTEVLETVERLEKEFVDAQHPDAILAF